jgi:hypothetical protein
MANIVQLFKLTNESRPTRLPAIVHQRNKLIVRLSEQIQAANASQTGERLTLPTIRRIRNKETGEIHSITHQRRVRQDWWVGQTGKLCFELRYGMKRIELAKGKGVIEVGDRSELVPTIEKLILAINAGELDQQITDSVGSYGREIPKIPSKKS